jgi:hypothetical protein
MAFDSVWMSLLPASVLCSLLQQHVPPGLSALAFSISVKTTRIAGSGCEELEFTTPPFLATGPVQTPKTPKSAGDMRRRGTLFDTYHFLRRLRIDLKEPQLPRCPSGKRHYLSGPLLSNLIRANDIAALCHGAATVKPNRSNF